MAQPRPVIAQAYRDRRGKARWRLMHGKITGNGGEAFASPSNARRAIRALVYAIRTRPVHLKDKATGKVVVL